MTGAHTEQKERERQRVREERENTMHDLRFERYCRPLQLPCSGARAQQPMESTSVADFSPRPFYFILAVCKSAGVAPPAAEIPSLPLPSLRHQCCMGSVRLNSRSFRHANFLLTSQRCSKCTRVRAHSAPSHTHKCNGR